MIEGKLLHPNILLALARAGHGSKVLITDGNYPNWTKRGPNAEMVYLNLAPGVLKVTEILSVLTEVVPFEAAEVMATLKSGPYAMLQNPPIWQEFSQLLAGQRFKIELQEIERFAFYEAAGRPDVCLHIASGDQRGYANLLLTIGVVKSA